MKLTTALGAVVLVACGPAGGSMPEPTRCGPSVPRTAQHPIALRAGELAGDYQLIQVETQPAGGTVRSGHLHLAQLDSTARIYSTGGPVRELTGWVDYSGSDSTRLTGAASRDPEHPGAVLTGEHLRLGDIGAFDGYVDDLTITAVGPEGFWGWWRAHPRGDIATDPATGRAVPDPAGYFCALRRTPDR